MSLDKTLTDQYRLPLKLDKFPVAPILPANFATMYPKFIEFIDTYYDEYDSIESPARHLNELQHNRDMVDVTPKLLRLIGQEFFLGKDYTDSILDKQSAIQISNLLYRSKGSSFSIEQFFRIFFGFDINIEYGRDEIFAVGDPAQEKLLFTSGYRSGGTDASGNDVAILYPGNRLKFNFSDGAIQVYALALTPKVEIVPSLYIRAGESAPQDYIDDVGVSDYIIRTAVKTTYNFFYLLKEDEDYEVDYDSNTIAFLKPGIDNSVKPGDPWLDHLAEYGEIAPPSQELDFAGLPFGPLRYPQARIETTRRFPAGSPLGSDISNKRLTDNSYYQVFSILIKTPISVNAWKDVYKDFIHPSGVYLAGEVLLETSTSVGLLPQPTSTEKYDVEYEGVGTIDDAAYSEVTELNVMASGGIPHKYPWISADTNAGASSWWDQVGIITSDGNTYYTNPNPDQGAAGQPNNSGARGCAYYTTGFTDVSVEVTWKGLPSAQAGPVVCINPNDDKFGLALYYEDFGDYGYKYVLWNLGQEPNEITIAATASAPTHTPGVPVVLKMEVVGRFLTCYVDGSAISLVRNAAGPPAASATYDIQTYAAGLYGSTLHGISIDVNKNGSQPPAGSTEAERIAWPYDRSGNALVATYPITIAEI